MAKHLPIKFVMFGAMSLLGLPVEAAPPAPDEAAGLRVNLAIDTSLLDSAVGARLEPEIAKQLGPVLEEADLHVVSPPEVGEQMLSVRVTAFDEEQRNYELHLQLGSEGGVKTVLTVNCDACNERRLIAKLVEETPRLVSMSEENLANAENGGATVAEPHSEVPGPVPELPKRLVGPLGGTGAGMMAVGVVALAVGSYLFGRGIKYEDENPAPGTYSWMDYRPVGGATFAAGLLVAGLGTTLLAVDLHRARKGHAPRFGLQMAPTSFGIQFHQRF